MHEGFVAVILGIIPAFIYVDAADHGIGKHPGRAGSLSAGAWASWTLLPFFGPLIALYYIYRRVDLIRLAKSHPVIVPPNRRDLTAFAILACGVLGYLQLVGYIDRVSAAEGRPAREIPPHLRPSMIEDDQ